MEFESAEKRVEICVKQESLAFVDLRQFDAAFWRTALAKAGAFILSKMSHQLCDAYVLSESSLFVWQDRVLLITCGDTSLVDTALEIVTAIGSEHLQSVSYQRQHEVFAHRQSRSFSHDVQCLTRVLPGEAYRMGHLDGHHQHLFVHGKLSEACAYSALHLYQIKGELSQYLRGDEQDKQAIFAQLQLDELLPEFSFDTHLFSPCGYSLNAVSQKHYLTLHITPQLPNSYLSLETNLADGNRLEMIAAHLLTLFRPSSWDVSGFDMSRCNMGSCAEPVSQSASLSQSSAQTSMKSLLDEYRRLSQSRLAVNNHVGIYTEHYRQTECEIIQPVTLLTE
ncbi:S-adenosylmethionine decarboxylase proenzyme [Shewanella sp. AS1]|uniref:S-adenosylmethionine decarboxylase proenzyme n=1 Tax=Shewanella sp. AS1 TaxID=2907626 RepID=UPI001F2060F4|nr:S-adenosylmethionine decarboxylase proenzyme [Shewanella sp. AS1]MCE9678379.1 S-adenosylmethionine decarboxylase proenzyme [Shewanella sp. AS1]